MLGDGVRVCARFGGFFRRRRCGETTRDEERRVRVRVSSKEEERGCGEEVRVYDSKD